MSLPICRNPNIITDILLSRKSTHLLQVIQAMNITQKDIS